MRKFQLTFLLVLLDWIFAAMAWATFFYLRKLVIENEPFVASKTFILGTIFIPALWVFIYYLQGTYINVKRLSRFKMLSLHVSATLIGTIFIFFTFLLDDDIVGYQQYYRSVIVLFATHFTFGLVPRLVFITVIVSRLHRGINGFKTLMVGGSEKAVTVLEELQQLNHKDNDFIGFVNINGVDKKLEGQLPYLGHADHLEQILANNVIEEVIIALDSTEHVKLQSILTKIDERNVVIKILPDTYDILSGSVKTTNIKGALLMEIATENMPIWQQTLKRFLDVAISLIAIIILLPLYIILALIVKASSTGPIFFTQERIGLNGKTFQIIKYRTMFVGAEKNGPQLSSSSDPRITPIGKFLRKTRLDEFPQFYNVLVGEMSLVGPRPERQFYIDQIVAIEPQYLHLNKVRPGITSWGQVKYGYAENVEQMLQRMKYDLLYLKNRTIALDFKIMLYTILIIFKGAGK
ncbi:MAG: sugar transferase [Bacteroidota bacterium]